jgi:hypothetical protein
LLEQLSVGLFRWFRVVDEGMVLRAAGQRADNDYAGNPMTFDF